MRILTRRQQKTTETTDHYSELLLRLDALDRSNLYLALQLAKMERQMSDTNDLINKIASEKGEAKKILTDIFSHFSDQMALAGLTPEMVTRLQTTVNVLQNNVDRIVAALAGEKVALNPTGATPAP